jgi:pantoate--beta-alanine ligase
LIIVRTVPELREAILERRRARESIGFVPTMGFLHEGQLSLIRRARSDNGCVVVSLFVNPRVFPTPEEAARFPRDERRDLALLEPERVDIVFSPEAETIFPVDDSTSVTITGLRQRLEGASRPGHLDGVVTALLKLINLVGPARVYLGQKDAHQLVAARQLIRDLFINVKLVALPTVREEDGLALSWHNAALSIEERHAATCLFDALTAARKAYERGERSAEVLRARMHEVIDREPMARIDYLAVADAETLAEVQRVTRPALAMLAVRIGRTRLTDCLPLAWDVA